MSKGGFSVADLQKAQKKLNSVEVAESKSGGSAVPAPQDSKALHSLEELYESHGGDLDLIFAALNANPAKAKKPHHRPKTAQEFAEKYMQGYYTIVEDEEAAAAAAADHKEAK